MRNGRFKQIPKVVSVLLSLLKVRFIYSTVVTFAKLNCFKHCHASSGIQTAIHEMNPLCYW